MLSDVTHIRGSTEIVTLRSPFKKYHHLNECTDLKHRAEICSPRGSTCNDRLHKIEAALCEESESWSQFEVCTHTSRPDRGAKVGAGATTLITEAEVGAARIGVETEVGSSSK